MSDEPQADDSSSTDRASSIDIPAPVEYMVDLLIPTVADSVDVSVDFIHQNHVVVHIYNETQQSSIDEGAPLYSIALPTSGDGDVELVRTPTSEDDEWFAARRDEGSRDPGPDLTGDD